LGLKVNIKMKKETSIWINLYNTLFVISSMYEDLQHLESSVFEVLDELESSIADGLRQKSLNFYRENNWIDEDQEKELQKFHQFLDGIDAKYWNEYDFDNSEDWILARAWAKSIIQKLDIKMNGWNSTGEIVIEE